ncbi:phosphate/phosphite/phosphonate ABC transporter substrate-binding protein [Oceanispirochaeta sp.]|jgi:phosphonate transport system substrate-binding protein|uniref:phosphate/phosphite/phosphonate ABC transporter substrate-binding protein n=1 Tax=Oceanispirochaeta sp. TaxID=2035350 RepID=UPI0026358ACF|nr:phosphate/phosphite/phosphonate ABC transporter substrate-binding protein [Oceanispirochaeta sp.]MDA3956789.1 phosphate/phosphite/phosphonate ABC transporter substrate-binding protein [Oceanispirochaeta sp.]
MKKLNRGLLRFITTFILLILLSQPVVSETRPTYRLGYSSSQNPELLIGRMKPIMNIISEALNADIEFVSKKTFSEMQKAYINQEIDFGIINAYSYLRILPYDSVILIAARRIENSREYRTYFFARKDSGINNIEGLKGKVIALGDPYSTSSYLIPHYIFKKQGIYSDSDFEKTIIISKQDSLILSVLNRTADAGVSASFIFNDQPEAVKSALTVFKTSEPFPLGPFIANKNLEPSVIETLKETLLSLNKSIEGRSALESSGIEVFEEVEADTYKKLLEIKDSLNLN